MQRRHIPSSATGERIPVIGCGTWQGFDIGTGRTERDRLDEVLQTLFDAGGAVIDSSPMYGRAEAVAGDLLTRSPQRAAGAFVATKVWTRGAREGRAQMETSFRLLRRDSIDLMQVHNLLDWRTHLPLMREWKRGGRIRYVGVTHYTASAHAELESVLLAEPLDFVQFNYSAVAREAERRLLPLASERGVAVIVNLPFGGGSLLQSLSARALPGFAAELGCTTWAALLLKFVLSHPAVTCVIPGTGNPRHQRDNVEAGVGPLPDAEHRERIAEALAT